MARSGREQPDRSSPVESPRPGAGNPTLCAQDIWREHRHWVAALLLAHKPREVELEDLLQEVALSVVRNIAELRDPGAVKGWLRTVAINEARAAGRKATVRRKGFGRLRLAARQHDERAESNTANRSYAERLAADEHAARVMTLAADLPESYREPLLLRCARGMSYRQIAEITGLPETTIETRIARGRRMLRELAAKAERDAAETTPERTAVASAATLGAGA